MAGPIVFFDLETGGLSERHPDIQIAAIAVVDGKEIAAFEAKIAFDESMADPSALSLNSYDKLVWGREAIPEKQACVSFARFLEPFKWIEKVSARTGSRYRVARLGGHNVESFDAPRLAAMFKRHGVFLPADNYRALDTKQLALWYFHMAGVEPKSFKLGDLCDHFGISTDGAHDALSDVRMTSALAARLMAPRERE